MSQSVKSLLYFSSNDTCYQFYSDQTPIEALYRMSGLCESNGSYFWVCKKMAISQRPDVPAARKWISQAALASLSSSVPLQCSPSKNNIWTCSERLRRKYRLPQFRISSKNCSPIPSHMCSYFPLFASDDRPMPSRPLLATPVQDKPTKMYAMYRMKFRRL